MPQTPTHSNPSLPADTDSKAYLEALADRERVKANHIAGVQKVLIILSGRGMALDIEALRQKTLLSYPEAAVFFRTLSGKPMGVPSPKQVDLLIDFTGPGQRSSWFYAIKLFRMTRFAVGRNAGFFRSRLYHRIYDEKRPAAELPTDLVEHERVVQKELLALAGVAFVPAGDTTVDRGKVIALELPPLSKA